MVADQGLSDCSSEHKNVDLGETIICDLDKDTNFNQSRPENIPEKFWDPENQTIRTEALIKSYIQLEKKIGNMVTLPTNDDPSTSKRIYQLLGQPDSPEDYQISIDNDIISTDPEINNQLYEAGFTSKQAQLVYDLASKHLLPIIDEINTEAYDSRDVAKLSAHFGSEEKWLSTASQIKSWAQVNLNTDVFESLASSPDGILAMHQMMQTQEPQVISETSTLKSEIDTDQLAGMMRDPRYWRDKDPSFVARVTEGYRRAYND